MMSSSSLARKMIDIGANLTDPMFKGIYNSSQKHQDDFHQMLSRAKRHGVEKIIITGGSLEDSKQALDIAKLDSNLFSTVGCHPTRCNEFTSYLNGSTNYLADLEKLALDNKQKVVAIGEIGLDYDRLHFCSKEIQLLHFEQQLALAGSTKLPLFLHNRNSTDDFVRILNRNREKFMSSSGVVHSFDGSAQDLEKILELGLYIGLNGCSLKTDQNLEVAKLVPSDRLMIETDCPWCEIKRSHASFKHIRTEFKRTKNASDPEIPVKNRNEPAMLVQILEVLSTIRQEDIQCLSEQIYQNTLKLFFS